MICNTKKNTKDWQTAERLQQLTAYRQQNSVREYAYYQTFTLDKWNTLEQVGAVFLPASGRRYGSDVGGVQGGYGWSATPDGASYANCLYFGSGGAGTDSYGNRIYGLAVRLVQSL
ncbi:MAG: hypothetical protein ACI30A_02175 [Paludibacteraceae bacterium]